MLKRAIFHPDFNDELAEALAFVASKARSENFFRDKDRARRNLNYILASLDVSESTRDTFMGPPPRFADNDIVAAHCALRLWGRYRHSPSNISKTLAARNMIPQVRSKYRKVELPLLNLTLKGIKLMRGPRSALNILPLTRYFRQLLYRDFLASENLPYICSLHLLVSDIMLLGAFRPGELLLSSTSTKASLEVVKLKHVHIQGKCLSDLVKNSSGFESGVRAIADLVKKGQIQFWAIVLQTTKTVQVAQTKVTITAAEKFSFKILSRFLKSILDRCSFGENVSVESPAFGYVVSEDNMLRVKFFTLKAFRSIDEMLMKPFSKLSVMKISPYSRRKGWATLLASVGTDMVKVRVLLRHSIGNLRHYVRLDPSSLIQTQEAVLAKWDQDSLNVSDFTLPVLMELANIAVDDDGVRSRQKHRNVSGGNPDTTGQSFSIFSPSLTLTAPKGRRSGAR